MRSTEQVVEAARGEVWRSGSGLAAHGFDARQSIRTALAATFDETSDGAVAEVETTAGRLGAALERWLRLGCLARDGASGEEWKLVDACIVDDQRLVSGGAWHWTFIWSHASTGAGAMVYFVSCGQGRRPESAAGRRGLRAPVRIVADSTAPGVVPQLTVGDMVTRWQSNWRFAETLEELAAATTPGGHVATLGVASSPVVVTPAVQGLAQLRGPARSNEDQAAFFDATVLDVVGTVKVREQPWIPRDTWPTLAVAGVDQAGAGGGLAGTGGDR